MVRQSRKRVIRFLTLLSIVMIASLTSSCNKDKCEGCYEDAPWSAYQAERCFPDKDMCEEELGEPCERCK